MARPRLPGETRTAIAQLGRTSLLGVTFVYTLQGAASAPEPAGAPRLLLALLAATAAHLAVYAWNDVADLAIDSTEPRRAPSPLVRGTLTPRQVVVGAGAAAAVALVLAALAGGAALLAMAATLALLGAYDRWGKRASFPPLTDAVQGLGWAALVTFGATAAGAVGAATAWLGAVVVVQILLVNGVLGALRDLANDARHGARTTALLLGARPAADGARLPAAVWVYAVLLHLAQVGLLLAGVSATAGPAPAAPTAVRTALVLAVGAGCLALLVTALRFTRRGATRSPTASWSAGLGYILGMLALPTVLVTDGLDAPRLVALLVLFLAPWLASRWVRATARAVVHRSGSAP